MAKRKPLVSQHFENISREALEKYENRLNKNLLYGPQACCGEQTLRHAIVRAFAVCAFFAQGADDGKKEVMANGEIRKNL